MTALSAPFARVRGLPLWQPLASRDFKLLWSGETISLLGDQFHYVALAWLVLELTGSGLALGSVLLASSIPRAVALLVGGALSDRVPARRLLLASNLGRAVLTGLLGVLAATGSAELWTLAAIGVVFGIVDAVHMPAFRSLVPRVVDSRAIAPATSLIESTIQLSSLIGPPIAGVVVATVGIAAAFGVDAVSFVVAAISVALLTAGRSAASAAAAASDIEPPGAPPGEGMLASIRAGITYAFSIGPVRTLIAIALVMNLAFNGPIAVGLPWLADRVFDAGSVGFGVMLAAFGAGALAGSVLCGATGGRAGSPLLLVVTLGLMGVGLVAIALAPALPGAVVILAAIGLGVGYLNVLVIAWFQRRTEPAMLGRLMSIVFLASSVASPFSFALSGLLVDAIGVGLFVLAGLLVVATVTVVAITRSMPDFAEPAVAS